jgi:serine/threonine protein kinase
MAPYDPRSHAPFLPPPLGPVLGSAGPDSGLAFDPDRPLPLGALLAGRFEVLACLDEGRCGFLYRVRDRQDGARERVLKTFDPRRGEDKDAELFRREMRLLQRLNHARIPKGLGLYPHFELMCALQAYVEGEDLHSRVSRKGPLSEPEARDAMRQVLEVLAYLQSLRPPVLHRDIKPDNLLRDAAGGLWLIDFGCATDGAARPRDGREWTTLQTLGFAAPEQALGLQSYPASDCFSLAATMLFLVTGQNPVCFFDGLSGRYMIEAPLSEGFRALLTEMLVLPAAERLGRPQDALERLALLPALKN